MTSLVEELQPNSLDDSNLISDLVRILRDSINGNFSVGFLTDEDDGALETFWRAELRAISHGNIVLIAKTNDEITGVVIVTPESRSNGKHRAEFRKLMVHSNHQKSGIGSQLEIAACAKAAQSGISLLYLDSATDFLVERTYQRWGWQKVGSIPNYATTPDGKLVATTYFYKLIQN